MICAREYIINETVDEGIETVWEEEEVDDQEEPEF